MTEYQTKKILTWGAAGLRFGSGQWTSWRVELGGVRHKPARAGLGLSRRRVP